MLPSSAAIPAAGHDSSWKLTSIQALQYTLKGALISDLKSLQSCDLELHLS